MLEDLDRVPNGLWTNVSKDVRSWARWCASLLRTRPHALHVPIHSRLIQAGNPASTDICSFKAPTLAPGPRCNSYQRPRSRQGPTNGT
jgi:hypothetical protein